MDAVVTVASLTGPRGPLGLSDPVWDGVARRRLQDARSGRRPVQATHVRLAEAGGVLWARFECEATAIRATMTRYKDKVWTEGAVEIYLRPDPGGPLFEFQVSPLGTCRDLRVADPGGPEQVFDDSWSCAGLVTDARVLRDGGGGIRGWSAVFGIPLSGVAASESDGAVASGGLEGWGLGAFRLEYDPEEFSALRWHPALDAHDEAFLCRIRLDEGINPSGKTS